MPSVSGDNPISMASQDLLGRQATAEVIAEELRVLDASEGYIVGILGSWGCGKTSLVNLIRGELGRGTPLAILDFNPWMFSGAEQLVERFFGELAAQLRIRGGKLEKLANDLEDYAAVLSPLRLVPVVGTWYERVFEVLKAMVRVFDRHPDSVGEFRMKLVEELTKIEQPIVVVLDDIDRLRSEEIRDVFKLVRLTANFPNLIYILVFDRKRVESALGEEGLSGRDYLEKILQLAYDVPSVPEMLLSDLIGKEVDRALSDVSPIGPFDSRRWPDVFAEVVRPLIKNVRDLRRYAAAVHVTARGVTDQVALVDVLGLEAIRVFLPDVFTAVINAQAGLTTTYENYGSRDSYESPALKQSIEVLLKEAGTNNAVATAMINRLFPAAIRHTGGTSYGHSFRNSWLRDRRVANTDILSFYLQRVAGSGLRSFRLAEQAFAILADSARLETFLRTVPPDDLESVIGRLEVFEGEYPLDSIVPAIKVLLNLMGRMPHRDRGFFAIDSTMVIRRVVLRLLKQVDVETEREVLIEEVFPQLSSLSAKSELLNLVGHDEGSGHQLVSIDTCQTLGYELRRQIRAASSGDLAAEPDLLRLLLWYRSTTTNDEPIYELAVDDRLYISLLQQSVSESRSMPMDSRAITRTRLLHWDSLVKIFDNETQVSEFLARLNELVNVDGDLTELVSLANRYAEGWRPDSFSG